MQKTNHSRYLWYFLLFLILTEFSAGPRRLATIIRYPIPALCSLLAVLIALVCHEFAHAYTADRLGDPNPRLAGRVSLNPLVHLDPLGTIFIILTGFGWGKPVQFDPYNLKHPAQDGAVIAAAGPVINLFIAVISGLCWRFLPLTWSFNALGIFLRLLFTVNLSLGVFNLLPIYPLDGHHILRSFLSPDARRSYDRFNRSFGFLAAYILILPLFGGTSLASYLITPAINFASSLILGAAL